MAAARPATLPESDEDGNKGHEKNGLLADRHRGRQAEGRHYERPRAALLEPLDYPEEEHRGGQVKRGLAHTVGAIEDNHRVEAVCQCQSRHYRLAQAEVPEEADEDQDRERAAGGRAQRAGQGGMIERAGEEHEGQFQHDRAGEPGEAPRGQVRVAAKKHGTGVAGPHQRIADGIVDRVQHEPARGYVNP